MTITPTEGTLVYPPVKRSDLKIINVKKKGNYHYVYIKNIGKKTAIKSYLGIYIYIGKKLIKFAKVKAIATGKSAIIKVKIPKNIRK